MFADDQDPGSEHLVARCPGQLVGEVPQLSETGWIDLWLKVGYQQFQG